MLIFLKSVSNTVIPWDVDCGLLSFVKFAKYHDPTSLQGDHRSVKLAKLIRTSHTTTSHAK
jgi:hypothetical protein